jgi:hypothetical protein
LQWRELIPPNRDDTRKGRNWQQIWWRNWRRNRDNNKRRKEQQPSSLQNEEERNHPWIRRVLLGLKMGWSIVVIYEARTLLGLGVSSYRTCVVSDTDTTNIITLNYMIFSNYYRCRRVSFRVMSRVRVRICIRAS